MTEALFKDIQDKKIGDKEMFFRIIYNGKRIETVWAQVIEGREGNIAEELSPRSSIINEEALKNKNLLTMTEAAKSYDMSGDLKNIPN